MPARTRCAGPQATSRACWSSSCSARRTTRAVAAVPDVAPSHAGVGAATASDGRPLWSNKWASSSSAGLAACNIVVSSTVRRPAPRSPRLVATSASNTGQPPPDLAVKVGPFVDGVDAVATMAASCGGGRWAATSPRSTSMHGCTTQDVGQATIRPNLRCYARCVHNNFEVAAGGNTERQRFGNERQISWTLLSPPTRLHVHTHSALPA